MALSLQLQAISQSREVQMRQQGNVACNQNPPSLPTSHHAYENLQNHPHANRTHIANHLNVPPQHRPSNTNSRVLDLPCEENTGNYNSLPLNRPYTQTRVSSSPQNTRSSRPQDFTFHLAPPDITHDVTNQSRNSQMHTQTQITAESIQQRPAQHSHSIPHLPCGHTSTSASQTQNSSSLQRPVWSGVQFEFRQNHEPSLVLPLVTPVQPQFFNPRPNDGPPQTERNDAQQTRNQPTHLTTIYQPRQSSIMPICPAENQTNQQSSTRQSVQFQRGSRISLQQAPPALSPGFSDVNRSNHLHPSEEFTDPHEINHAAADDDVQNVGDDTEESDVDGVFDLAENRKYQELGASRRAQKTMARCDGIRLEKLAKPPVECSQHERLAIAIQHYNNLLLGIVRKGKGRKGNRSLPEPPSDDEYSAWDKRKLERRRIVDKAVEQACSLYRRKHPHVLPAQLARVGDHAAEDANSSILPVKFTSLVALRNSGVHYSTTVASTCEGALALAGFARFTYDWTDSIKSKWNEAISYIILQEWEKCYKRGDADDYDVDAKQVTAKNLRQVLDRWFNTKAREFSSQCQKSPEEKSNQAKEQEAAKEKNRQRQLQKRVCQLRRHTLKTFFPEHHTLQAILSERTVHSEDEVDSAGHSYRKPKLWRHQHLNEFLHELDELHIVIKAQEGDQACTSATKALHRGPYAPLEDPDLLARPPKGFPRDLLDQQFMNQYVSRVAIFGLELSAHQFDLRPLLAHARWLQLAEAS
ncbi:uncharacterized protein MELLADRAFT_93927 [Melampsora larici-populina 98AG31]|uniref:Uncharacterized protein n=1 Tax=Melampsora larici-populina (strain 98AG31 / pathotype 3-4-7) TaxID=747676 RepID=F4S5S6_MELLP|nr:uncharacterized protein MELLADRAFT_93927 [Melampsora larici-populina 98AG31]EGF99949.1 hypothetical protein MELLADRAFT_93927 [Melampsora larici-populina 98AG31]